MGHDGPLNKGRPTDGRGIVKKSGQILWGGRFREAWHSMELRAGSNDGPWADTLVVGESGGTDSVFTSVVDQHQDVVSGCGSAFEPSGIGTESHSSAVLAIQYRWSVLDQPRLVFDSAPTGCPINSGAKGVGGRQWRRR